MIELKHYLGTNLMLWHEKNKSFYPLVISNNTLSIRGGLRIDEYKAEGCVPIMYPLSALTEPVLEGGKIPIVELAKICGCIDFGDIKNLTSYRFRIEFWDKNENYKTLSIVTVGNSMSFYLADHGRICENHHNIELLNKLFELGVWIFDQSLFNTGELIDKRNVK